MMEAGLFSKISIDAEEEVGHMRVMMVLPQLATQWELKSAM